MSDQVPETLTVLPDPTLFRLARWMQVVSLCVAAGAVLFALLPLIGVRSGADAGR